MDKKIIVLVSLYLFQFLATSCDICDCSEFGTFERNYNGLELEAWNTSGFQISEIKGPINKNSFGITLSIQFDLKKIALNNQKSSFSGFGFASAMACDCRENEYINVDDIDTIEITVLNTENQVESIVTDNFTTIGYDGLPIKISALFENRADWQDGFQLDLQDFDMIPNTAIFKVNVFLASGAVLSEQTAIINFNI